MASNILNFSPDRLITGINIIDGMLFFTDNKNEPKKINIEKFKGNLVDPQSGKTIEVSHNKTTKIYGREFKERDITVLKEHPTETLSTFLTESADLKPNEVPTYTTYNPDPVPALTSGGNDTETVNSVQTFALKVENNTDPSSNSIDNVILNGLVSGFNDIADTGFIWSQDYSNASDLISNGTPISTGAKKSESTNTFTGTSFGKKIEAGDLDVAKDIIYFLPYAQARGSNEKVYTQVLGRIEVQEFKILAGSSAIDITNSITSLTVAATQRSNGVGAVDLFKTAIDLNADYADSGVWAEEVGFYISKGYSLDTDTITLQELIEGAETKASDANLFLELPAKTPGRLSVNSKHFTGGASYSIEQGLNYFYIAYVRASNGETYYSSNSFASNTTLPSLSENIITKLKIVPTQNGEGEKPRVQNLRGISINSDPPSAEAVGEILFQSITNARTGFITEYGFYFSKKVTSRAQFITAFSQGAQADGSPTKSGFPDTYKVAVESNASGVTNVDINNSLFSYDVGNKLSLESGELVYFMAYAISSTGAEGTATALGVSVYPEVFKVAAGSGEAGADPAISIVKSDYSLTSFAIKGPVAFDITYRIEYVPSGKTVKESGVYLALPVGDAITSERINGFSLTEEIKNNPSLHTKKSQSFFTFTGTSSSADNPATGDYNAVITPPAHTELDDNSYIQLGGSRINAYSLFAYIQLSDGTYKETEIVAGPLAHKFVFGSSTISMNEGAPTVNTYNNDLRAVDKASIRNNTFKLLGAIGSDGGVNTGNAANDVGFYISKVRPTRSIFSTLEIDMANWIADSNTVKLSLTGAALTAARNHSTVGGLTFQDYELVVNSANFPALGTDTAPTTYYYRAFCIPSTQTEANLNKTKFGGEFEVTTIPASQTQSTNPVVTTDGYKTSEGFGFTLRGTAKPTENTYTIKTKKFYYKDSSHFPSNPTATQVITELQDPTGRNSITATGGDSFSANVNLSNVDYYFVAVVTTELNGVESSEVFAERGKKIANAESVVTSLPTPGIQTLNILQGNPPTFGGKITTGLSSISSRGFYWIGKEGTNSLARPSTGEVLKSAATSPPSGQVGGTISSSTSNQHFHEEFSNFRTDYTYYFSAFAINSNGVETISPVRAVPIVQSNTPKTLKATPSFITFDNKGLRGARGNIANISVQTTPDANTWSWKVSTWKGAYGSPYIVRETSGGVDKLLVRGYPLNSLDSAEAKLTITHKEDASIKKEIIIKQDGKYNDNFYYDESPNDYSNYQPPGFYY
jgi:hypothetical protein